LKYESRKLESTEVKVHFENESEFQFTEPSEDLSGKLYLIFRTSNSRFDSKFQEVFR
jgi:hypothetical protein